MATHHTTRLTSSKRSVPVSARHSKSASLSKRQNAHGASKKAARHVESDSEEDIGMAASFLQYCTTCEKQIIVPSNFVLYCSESCRKQDNDKSLSPIDNYCSPLAEPFASFSFESLQFPDIVTPRSPTAPSKYSSCTLSETSSDDNITSGDERPDLSRKYHSRHRSTYSDTMDSLRSCSRPRYSRSSTSFSATPSLSHTPTSSISYSMPYTPVTPLSPSRPNATNRSYSSYAGRYTDLATRVTYATTTPSTAHHQYSLKSAPCVEKSPTGEVAGEILHYEKSPIMSVGETARGSLRQLFGGGTGLEV